MLQFRYLPIELLWYEYQFPCGILKYSKCLSYPLPFYGTPIFNTISGISKCIWEENTVKRENPVVTLEGDHTYKLFTTTSYWELVFLHSGYSSRLFKWWLGLLWMNFILLRVVKVKYQPFYKEKQHSINYPICYPRLWQV